MDETERSSIKANVAKVVERLEIELDPTNRLVLGKFLLEEEDRFARTAEQLDLTDHYLTRCRANIERHEGAMSRLRDAGVDTTTGDRIMLNLMHIRALLSKHRNFLLDKLDEA